MKRYGLSSCASSLVIALLIVEAAAGQDVITVAAGQSQTVSTQITDNGTTQNSVQVNGGGIVTLTNNANIYSGQTSVSGSSTLYYSNDSQLGLSSLGSPNTVNLGDSSLNGTLSTTPNALSFVSIRNINLNNGGGALVGPVNGNLVTYSGVISGAGTLNINGGLVAITNSNNSYSGGTLVNGNGTLRVNADAALDSQAETSVQLGDNNSHGTLQWTNNTAVSSGRSIILGSGGGTISSIEGGTVNLSGTIAGTNASTNTTTLTTPLNGTGAQYGLTIGGNGVVNLAGANIFTGDLTVLKGATLAIGSDEALGGYTIVSSILTGQSTATLGKIPNNLILNGTLRFTGGVTIDHPIEIGSAGATIDTNGNGSVITTVVSNNPSDSSSTNSLTVVNGSTSATGTLVLDGINTYTGGTTVQNGTNLVIGDSSHSTASVSGNVTVNSGATIGGSGTIAGQLLNQGGTVVPANQLRAQYYTQNNGNLEPIVGPTTAPYVAGSNNSGSAELQVSGASVINGGVLSPGFASGFLRAGRYQIFAPGALSGSGFSNQAAITAQTALTDIPSIGLTGYLTQDAQGNYYLVLNQLSSLPSYDHANLFPVLSNAAIDEAQQAVGSLLDRLAGARTEALADELGVALTEYHRVRGTSPFGAWVMPLGNNGTVSGNNGVSGYNVQGGGLMAGVDTEWKRGLSIGIAAGYTNNFVKQSADGSGTISMPRLAVYSGWWRGPFAIDAVVALGSGTIDGTRVVAVPDALQAAYSNHVANEKSAALQASAAWAFDGWVVSPAFGVKFVNLRETGFTESGTTLYNFSVANGQLNSLRPYASANFTKRFMISDHWALVPKLKVGFEHEVINDIHSVTTQTAGDFYNWIYAGLLPGADTLRIDGGLELETSRDAAFFVDYNHMQSSTTTNQYVSGGFRYRL